MKRKTDHNKILFLMLPITALALYIMRIVSGYNISDGLVNISYAPSYPLILFSEYAFITLLFMPLIKKKKEDPTLFAYLLPLMLFSALGMLRIDSDRTITSREADHTPALMFIVFFAVLVFMIYSEHSVAGAPGTVMGAALFPAFGITFAPFIAATAFFIKDKNKKEKKISLILNSLSGVAAAVYSIIRLEKTDFSFSKNYIPAVFLILVLIVFFAVKKDFKLLPLGLLPLFPLTAGIFFGAFPTPLFTLAAAIAPLAVILITAAAFGKSTNLKGYAQKLVHNPVIYIITVVFILHTASSIFVNPGYFHDVYT